jgi:hypothetical protein
MAEPLNRLAARVEDDAFFLAPFLAAYARSEGLDEPGLAAALGCPPGELPMVRLCRAPRGGAPEFWEDVTAVAARFGMDPERLAEAVKRGRALRLFQAARAGEAGSLMAARDRDAPRAGEPPGDP